MAEEILLENESKRSSLDKAQNLLSEVKQLKAKLSEYESCVSTDDDYEEEKSDTGGFKSMNERKRAWKNKRKNSSSPPKETFLKKQNTKLSPK